jgi:hypothetical protein
MGWRKKNWSDDPRKYAPHRAWLFDAVLADGAVFEFRDGNVPTLARVSDPVMEGYYTRWWIEYLDPDDQTIKAYRTSSPWFRHRSWALRDEADWLLAQITGGHKTGQALG